jgi:hypothetical protein
MGTYVMLSRLSPDGVKTLKKNPDRIKAVNSEVEALGAKVLSQYALLGAYDFLTVLEAPDPDCRKGERPASRGRPARARAHTTPKSPKRRTRKAGAGRHARPY